MNEEINKLKEKLNLDTLEQNLERISAELGAITDYNGDEYITKIKEFNEAKELLAYAKELGKLEGELASNEEMLEDSELGEFAKEEKNRINADLEKTVSNLKRLTQKPLPNDEKKAILEIRPGVGGVEASLFAEDLYRMYTSFCSEKGYKIDILSLDYNQEGGIKEATFLIEEPGTYGLFRFESGVHRVQRVPKTEALGRIHTSTATVAVIPQFDIKSVQINMNDLRIDVYRSSGPGGQSVNTTDSAVRIYHIPTKITVTCQNGKSQHKNKEMALSVLASKLEQLEQDKRESEMKEIKSEAVADSDRSSKIRTYNFPQGRITDHRIGKSWFNITPIMDGDIEDIINSTATELRGN